MTTPAGAPDHLEHVVGHVAGDVGDGTGRRVAEEHRRLTHLDGLAHRVVGDVAEVDEHAEPVQLAHDLFAEAR